MNATDDNAKYIHAMHLCWLHITFFVAKKSSQQIYIAIRMFREFSSFLDIFYFPRVNLFLNHLEIF